MTDSRPRDLAAHTSRYDHDEFAKKGEYISAVDDTTTKNTMDNPFITIHTKRPVDDEGNPSTDGFGVQIDLDSGNTYKNQFTVGTVRYGYALTVLGGSGREVWVGGEVSQKSGIRSNDRPDNFIVRRNLSDATEPIWSAIEETKGNLESLEAEMELLAKTLEHGEWTVAANAAVRPGQMHLASASLIAQQNQLAISNTDGAGKTHGWATLDAGDYVEVLQKEDTTQRDISHDYGLFLVTAVNPGEGILLLDLELYQGQGDAVADELFEVRVLDIAESELDMAALDGRYAQKSHSHSYAPSSHSHSYASTEHEHDAYSETNHTHSVIFRSGTSTSPSLSKGEPFLNTSYKVIYIGT